VEAANLIEMSLARNDKAAKKLPLPEKPRTLIQ